VTRVTDGATEGIDGPTPAGERSHSGSARPIAPPRTDPLEEAAVRARVSARLFEGAPEIVKIGRYEVVERLGAGGMGVVYSARDPELGRSVALKLLTPHPHDDDRRRQRLLGEARALARLSHPHVVQIHEIGVHEGAIFLALELVDGETLQTWQRRPGRRWQEILAAYIDAAEGLAAAHGVGVIHRDVKASNILIGVDGRVRVADFGLARAASDTDDATTPRESHGPTSEVTTAGVVLGTPAYMSPEQALGRRVDAGSDQFSFCVALFEALYGARPFEIAQLSTLRDVTAARLRRRVTQPTAAPQWILPLLVRGLQPAPEQRYPHLRALVAALREAPRRRARRWLIAAGATALALLSWGAVALSDTQDPCPAPSAELPGAWDPSARAAIRSQFLASGLPFAEAAFDQLERSFDAAVVAWSAERHGSCLRTWVDRSQSAEQFDLGMACLAAHEQTLRGVAQRIRAGEGRVVAQAHTLLRGLDDPSACNRTDLLRGGPSPPPPDLRDEVDALRERLGELRVVTAIGDGDHALALADDLVARSAIHLPLRAEAVFRRAQVLRRRGDLAAATLALEEAETAAEQLRDDPLASEIFAAQVDLALVERGDVARARVYAHLHEAKLRRLGADDRRWADHHAQQAVIARLAGDPSASLAFCDRAAAQRPAADLVGRTLDLRNAANALIDLGRIADAIERLHAARRLIVDELGPEHPDLAIIDANLGHALVDQGELSSAEETLELALAEHERHGGTDGIGAALARLALAKVALAQDRSQEALTLATRARVDLERHFPSTHGDVLTALRLLVNIHIAGRSWGPAMAATDALIAAHRRRGEAIPVELHVNAGEFLLRTGHVVEATLHFDQALLALSSGSGDQELRPYALNGRAKAALARGEWAVARELFDRTLPLARASGHSDLRAEVFAGAAIALRRSGGSVELARELAREALALSAELDPADELDELRAIAGVSPGRDRSRKNQPRP
jgi:tetratricopeptide (TPR) repeat protein